jgi:mannosyltransferase
MSEGMAFIHRIKVQTDNFSLTKKTAFLILSIIVCLAGLVRWYHIGAQSLWIDELYSATYAKMNFSDLFLNLKGELNPPLYFLLLHYWVIWFGYSETALRAMSLAFGILTIPMIFTVAKELFTPLTGLISALILSLSRFHIYFSQEARSYSLMGLLTLVSFYFLIKLIKENNARLDEVGYILVNSLLLYTHSACVFIVITQNCIWFVMKIFKRTSLPARRWMLYQVLSLVLFIPWLTIELHQFQVLQGKNIYGYPTFYGILNTFYQYSGSFFLLFVFFLIILIGIYPRLRKNTVPEQLTLSTKTAFLWIWVGLPILTPFILSQFVSPIYTARNTLSAAFGFYILIAVSLTPIRNKIMTSLLILVIFLSSAQNLITYYNTLDKEQWREVIDYVDLNAQAGDIISVSVPAYDYYNKRSDIVRVDELSELASQPKEASAPQLWVINSSDEAPGILQTQKGSFAFKQKQDFFRVSVSLYTASH